MTTDYDAHGYAARFAVARELTPQATETWVGLLTAAVGDHPVRVALDLGTGTGRFVPILRTAWGPALTLAVDISPAMLRQGSRTAGAFRVRADMDELPLAPMSLDAALCSMVLHYSPDPTSVCAGLHQALRPGGLLAVRTGTHQTLASYGFLRCFPTAAAAERKAMPQDDEVADWLSNAGFLEVTTTFVQTPAARLSTQFRKVAIRGFPSLQLVPWPEYVVGLFRFATACLWDGLRRRRPPPELTFFATGKRL